MSTPESNGIDGGFASPVFDSQAIFTAVMRALSRPGTAVELGARVKAPNALAPAAASVLAALADYDTPVWLDEGLRRQADVVQWIGFQTGAIQVKAPAQSRFAVCSPGADLPNLSDFALGTADYPDRSTTLIMVLDSLTAGAPLTLSGPGIETTATIRPKGLTASFFADWAINNALFPRGIDVLLVAGSAALGLPRTTRIRSA
jgi:alpha-D-ribose 1-methylphosphonate 5-triphosphate synthase subunit PhnH